MRRLVAGSSASAPSRTGNLVVLGLFLATVLSFGSFLAYRYNPPPSLAGRSEAGEIYFVLPGLSPQSTFSVVDLASIHWIAALPTGENVPQSARVEIALTAEGGGDSVVSVGELLPASPGIRYGGSFSSIGPLVAGRYVARFQVQAEDGTVLFARRSMLTLKQ